MPWSRHYRKVLLVIGFTAAGLLSLVLALPLWFPWVLRPLASSQGVHYGQYQREGYARFSLRDVSLTTSGLRFHAARLDALVPSAWLWRKAIGPANPKTFLSIADWRLETLASAASSQTSVSAEFQTASELLTWLRRSVPAAALSNGTLQVETRSILIPTVLWQNGFLRAGVELPSRGERLALDANLGNGTPFALQVHSPSLRLDASIALATNSLGLSVQASGLWWSNHIQLAAQFGRTGTLPESASLRAADFHLPGKAVDMPYQELEGSLSGTWQRGEFAFDLNANGRPGEAQTNVPPFKLELRASGDTNAVAVQTADISSPWLTARLGQPATIYRQGRLLRAPTTLMVSADLGQQPFVPVTGRLEGKADFFPGPGKRPVARFDLAGTEIGTASVRAQEARVQGSVVWPWLEVTQAAGRFTDGSEITAHGRIELQKKEVAAGSFEFRGPLPGRWLPRGYSYRELAVSGSLNGPLEHLQHGGEVNAAGVSRPGLRPLEVRLRWKGEEETISQINAEAMAGHSTLRLTGSARGSGDGLEIDLASLDLFTNQQPLLRLTQPCHVFVGYSKGSNLMQVATSPLAFRGPGGDAQGQATFEWPRRGTLQLRLAGIHSGLLGSFLTNQLPDVEIEKLQARSSWTNGPVAFGLDLAAKAVVSEPPGWLLSQADLTNPPARKPSKSVEAGKLVSSRSSEVASGSLPLSLDLKAAGDASGILITNFAINSQTSVVAVVRGLIPITLNPASASNIVQIDMARALQLSASTEPSAFFWRTLAEWTGTTLRKPNLDVNVSGTWASPQGHINLRAAQVQFRGARAALPALEDLDVKVQLDREQARLTQGSVRVQGQLLSCTGELPLGRGFWAGLKQKKLPSWQKASGRLLMHEAELGAFEPLFPELLAPQGELDLDISLLAGGKFEGQLEIIQARTRPLGSIGPVRDINVKMRLNNRMLKLEQATAQVSSARLNLTGQADLRGTDWLDGTLPPFEFSLSGSDVPLSRSPSSIIRSDLLLGVVKTNGAPPLVSGIATLRDSYFLSDLADLIPGKVATPQKRPPYFSVADPLLADWRLNVEVQGERFLKVRTTLFNGEVSANLKVSGTLEDPIALGDLRIDSGAVTFPFGSLQVQQGLVNLTSADPYRPELAITAASKQFGYDIRMEVTGPADSPIIQFNSTPPLSSEQILLMVTAGQLPQGTFSLTPQQRAQTMGVFLGRGMLSKLGFGDEAQQRLTIRSGEEISDQGRPTYHIEYKLTDRWSLEGEYDRFGDFDAGFKWRIYSK